ASLATRLADGCNLSCSAPNDSRPPTGMTSSPSITKRFAFKAASPSATSGKYRVRSLPDRAVNPTLSPALAARQRKPSHLGSYCQPLPAGNSSTCRASMEIAEEEVLRAIPPRQRRSTRRSCCGLAAELHSAAHVGRVLHTLARGGATMARKMTMDAVS